MRIVSDNTHDLTELPVQLTDVIFVPGLDKNLLSVGRMTNAGVDVRFERSGSTLVYNGNVVAHGPKVGNLYTYMATRVRSGTEKEIHENPPPTPHIPYEDVLPFPGIDYITENRNIIKPIFSHTEEEDLPAIVQIPQEEEPIKTKIHEKQQTSRQTGITITSTHTIIILLFILVLFIRKPLYAFNGITRNLETKANRTLNAYTNEKHTAFDLQSTLFTRHTPTTEETVSNHTAQEKARSKETSTRDVNKGITGHRTTFSYPVTDARLSHFNISDRRGRVSPNFATPSLWTNDYRLQTRESNCHSIRNPGRPPDAIYSSEQACVHTQMSRVKRKLEGVC